MATINLRIKDTSREYFFFGNDILSSSSWTAVETLDLSEPIKGNLLTALDNDWIEGDIPLADIVAILFPSSCCCGEVNIATNAGIGEGSLALPKSGVALPFRTIKAGTNISITETANEIVIDSLGGSSSASWGLITGTLSDQTDLNNELGDKVNTSQVLTDVPLGALFTDTIYNDSTIQSEVDANTNKVSSISLSVVGTTIPLTLVDGAMLNRASANSATTYITSGTTIGAWAKCLVNASSEPIVTGAIKIKGPDFIPGTDMDMIVSYDGNQVEYYFLERV